MYVIIPTGVGRRRCRHLHVDAGNLQRRGLDPLELLGLVAVPLHRVLDFVLIEDFRFDLQGQNDLPVIAATQRTGNVPHQETLIKIGDVRSRRAATNERFSPNESVMTRPVVDFRGAGIGVSQRIGNQIAGHNTRLPGVLIGSSVPAQ